jgi:hypothetical protein
MSSVAEPPDAVSPGRGPLDEDRAQSMADEGGASAAAWDGDAQAELVRPGAGRPPSPRGARGERSHLPGRGADLDVQTTAAGLQLEGHMERTCRGCRKPLSPEETCYIKDGLAYCCAACAGNAGCTCARDPLPLTLTPSVSERAPRAFPWMPEPPRIGRS